MLLQERTIPKTEHLESLFKKYPDVPKEVIVKEDVLRDGVTFTEAALEAGKGRRLKTYQLFSWDHAEVGKLPSQAPLRVPDWIDVEKGLYNLRRMRIRPRLTIDAPYVVDVIEGKLMLSNNGVPLAEIRPYPQIPKYFSKKFEDGTPYYEVVQIGPYLVPTRVCQHWGPKEECKYCDLNANFRSKKQLGAISMPRPYKKVEQVAEAMEEYFKEDWPLEEWPIGITIGGGAITKKLNGKNEDDFYLDYVIAIRERIGNRVPINCHTAPKTKEVAKRYRDAGVTFHNPNIEVWDKRLFEIICPGKNRVVGRDNWIRLTIEEVDVFGQGFIVPTFVVGVEMCQPWGFKTVAEAVQSTTEGFEYLMAHGVLPKPASWCIEALSDLAGNTPPPIDYFIQLDRNWYELWKKYRLPCPANYLMGPGRNDYPNSASFDMEG